MHSLLGYMIIGAGVGVMITLAKKLFGQGGAGQVREGVIVFRPRPATRVIFFVIAGMGLLLWAAAIHAIISADWQQTIAEFVVGIPLFWLALFGFRQTITLNAEEIRYERWYLKPVVMKLSDLDHYEIDVNPLANGFYLRSRSGARTIALNGLLFNVSDLATRMTQQTRIAQQPFRRQKWYRP